MSQYIFSLLLGYFVGSFPTAYLLVRWKARLDIRVAGSGNVGAMNTFNVTGSKLLGITVLLVDLLKGVIAVVLTSKFFGDEFWIAGIGGIGAMLGHSYSPWLRFHGGRGLATAAGVMLLLGWVFVLVWCVIWGIIFFIAKNIHLGNILASIGSPLVLFLIPERLLMSIPLPPDPSHLVPMASIICGIILVRHYQTLRSLLKPSSTILKAP